MTRSVIFLAIINLFIPYKGTKTKIEINIAVNKVRPLTRKTKDLDF